MGQDQRASATATATSGVQPAQPRAGLAYLDAAAAWGLVCVFLLIAKLWLVALPPINIALIRSEFAYSTLAVYAGIGLAGALLAVRAGFPLPLSRDVSAVQRFAVPLATGAALGLIAMAVDRFTHGTRFLAAQTGEATFNVAFPQSLPVYLAGPVLPEAAYHILPLPLLMLGAQLFIASDRGRRRAFYGLAAVVACIEPILQGGGILGLASGDKTQLLVTQLLPYFATSYPLNLAACLLFGRAGYLSPIVTRLGFYLVWHVLYGNFLYY